MAIVEDGTGVEGADSYIDTDYADAYHAARGHTAWTDAAVTTAQKEAAIIRATDHIDRMFGSLFRGLKVLPTQGLAWPRNGAYDDDGWPLDEVPTLLKKACAEYALRALLYGQLVPDAPPVAARQAFTTDEETPEAGDTLGRVKQKTESIGPIKESVTYDTGAAPLLAMYPAADAYLSQLLEDTGVDIIRG